MCGRFAFFMPPAELQKYFGLENLLNFPARYNGAPMQDHPIIIKNRMGLARWGLLPPWKSEDDKSVAAKMTNARSETVHEKPTFKPSWNAARRCIIPVNGFYEWHRSKDGKTKQPYLIKPKKDPIFAFAGLWHKTDTLITFTILTKQADTNIAQIHHRMPVIIPPNRIQDWFARGTDKAVDIINLANSDEAIFHSVANKVGNVRNDSADLLEDTGIRITA